MLNHIEEAFAYTGARVAKVTPNDLDTRTPCGEWDVRSLLNHATGVVARFGATASRTTFEYGDGHDFVGDDPGAVFDSVAKTTLHAWSQPGALDGTVKLGAGGEMPAQVAANINFLDTLVHGWDLARAIGQDATIDPDLATAGLEVAHKVVVDSRRGPDLAFGPEITVPDSASPSDKLVAFLGRQP